MIANHHAETGNASMTGQTSRATRLGNFWRAWFTGDKDLISAEGGIDFGNKFGVLTNEWHESTNYHGRFDYQAARPIRGDNDRLAPPNNLPMLIRPRSSTSST